MAGRRWSSILFGRRSSPRTPDGNEASSATVELPFDLLQETAIILSLEVNGLKATAILDSGATVCLVDEKFAARLQLQDAGSPLNVQTPTGATRARMVGRVGLTMGVRSLGSIDVAVYDLSAMLQAYGAAVDLVLGRAFFESFVLEFDFEDRLILATPSDSFDGELLPPALPLIRGGRNERSIIVSICGRAPIPAILDLGSSIPVMLSAAYASAQNLLQDKATSTAATATIDGVSISTTVSLESLAVGSNTFSGVPAEVYPAWRSTEFAAIIGLPVLARSKLILDFSGDGAWVINDARIKSVDFAKDRSGLGLALRQDRLVVVHVAKGGPAEAAGWREGEAITAINGSPVTAAFHSSDLAKWRQASQGAHFTLLLGDGSRRELTLRDYY